MIRPHGLKGSVVVELWTNRPERVTPGARLDGSGRALVVRRAVPAAGSGGWSRWIVDFDGLDTREGAEELRDIVLRAEPLQVEGVLWVHEMIGAELFDHTGEIVGVVEAIEANPASDLLILTDGRLVPLTFVDAGPGGRLTVSAPPGLLDPDE